MSVRRQETLTGGFAVAPNRTNAAPERAAAKLKGRALYERLCDIIDTHLPGAGAGILESVCRNMLGTAPTDIATEQLGSLNYWLRIFVRSKKLLGEERLETMARELDSLRF